MFAGPSVNGLNGPIFYARADDDTITVADNGCGVFTAVDEDGDTAIGRLVRIDHTLTVAADEAVAVLVVADEAIFAKIIGTTPAGLLELYWHGGAKVPIGTTGISAYGTKLTGDLLVAKKGYAKSVAAGATTEQSRVTAIAPVPEDVLLAEAMFG